MCKELVYHMWGGISSVAAGMMLNQRGTAGSAGETAGIKGETLFPSLLWIH